MTFPSRAARGGALRARRDATTCVSGSGLALAVLIACGAVACQSAPEIDAACARGCDTEWEGCYTGADQRLRACEQTCGGGDSCRARCREAHPLWKDHCDERHPVCLETCRDGSR